MKTVLVTGGTIRLGLAIARGLRAEGWRVITSSHREDSGADIVADLSTPNGAEELFERCVKKLGGAPDAVVNNAALFRGDALKIERVNFLAPKRLAELLSRTGKPGAVVNILDCDVFVENDHEDDYLRSKVNLARLTIEAARSLAPSLRVNAVAPGAVLAPTGVHIKAARSLLSNRPTEMEVANAVNFLLATESVTGCVLPVDGGRHLLGGGFGINNL